jgi:hypothetical protein
MGTDGGDEDRAPMTPFGGWVIENNRSAPLRRHRTSPPTPRPAPVRPAWLAQSAVLWPGPAFVSSSKDDLMQMVAS